jgi:8-oxo-dGTP pyrophosphatase MutT (NUDIX family)
LTRVVWKPNVTVAAVCEKDGKFLLVEEETEDGLRINQPAGHLEPGEALVDAVVRETLEETAFNFQPEYLVGVYSWRHMAKDITYLRFAFDGKITFHDATRALDKGIVRVLWLTEDEIRASASRHRSPLLMRCVDDFLTGQRFPLDLLVHYA